ncbi:MAG TPA: peptidase M22 [Candidatus Scatavimonas merdigallinarum]|uniref:N(6)-L-threonylcarbamoyladenine synthase n=1 Tax=Candidatus Scatavimonas merdigallinarum TaxID=2840914 RepID=A0A9D0ZGF8_9FIRM|nr:peptidase M22 [Candidatus Scatavimonas merdigallinarum]
MKTALGLDTSNYTTSAAVLKDGAIYQAKLPLPVKKGQKGLRQSEAVFHHTSQLPQVIKALQVHFTQVPPGLLGASDAPRREAGSYMPCFTVGLGAARVLSSVLKVPLYTFSHQQGHIAAALYSAEKLELLKHPFLAFHVSGGTTEALLVKPDRTEICKTQIVASTLDLNAGQVIDRTGVMLGISFPCGKELERLALGCDEEIKVRPVLKDANCCFSGLENICANLKKKGAPDAYIAKYCLKYVEQTVVLMCEKLLMQYAGLPVLFAGGVMSNAMIQKILSERFSAFFASPEFSCDNAAGIAVLADLKENGF